MCIKDTTYTRVIRSCFLICIEKTRDGYVPVLICIVFNRRIYIYIEIHVHRNINIVTYSSFISIVIKS